MTPPITVSIEEHDKGQLYLQVVEGQVEIVAFPYAPHQEPLRFKFPIEAFQAWTQRATALIEQQYETKKGK